MSKLMTYSMVSLVVILLTAFVLFNFQGKIKEAYAEATAKQTCKASVTIHAALKLRYADFSGEIKCPTVKLQINDKNEDVSKKKIADAMFDCWDQFGRGKLDLFSDNSIYCAICHRLTFDKNIKVNDFTEYLTTKKAPGQQTTYLQFLTTERTEKSAFLSELEKRKIEDIIDASKNNEYAIIFTYIKGRENLKLISEKAPYFAPVTFGLLVTVGYFAGYISLAIAAPIATPFLFIGSITGLVGYYYNVPFEHVSLISLVPYDTQNIQNLNCKEIPIKQ